MIGALSAAQDGIRFFDLRQTLLPSSLTMKIVSAPAAVEQKCSLD